MQRSRRLPTRSSHYELGYNEFVEPTIDKSTGKEKKRCNILTNDIWGLFLAEIRGSNSALPVGSLQGGALPSKSTGALTIQTGCIFLILLDEADLRGWNSSYMSFTKLIPEIECTLSLR